MGYQLSELHNIKAALTCEANGIGSATTLSTGSMSTKYNKHDAHDASFAAKTHGRARKKADVAPDPRAGGNYTRDFIDRNGRLCV